jgi:hypothetical protein
MIQHHRWQVRIMSAVDRRIQVLGDCASVKILPL